MPPRRKARRPGAPPTPVPSGIDRDPIKSRTLSAITALIFLTIAAVLGIPIAWLLVHGYRWAVS